MLGDFGLDMSLTRSLIRRINSSNENESQSLTFVALLFSLAISGIIISTSIIYWESIALLLNVDEGDKLIFKNTFLLSVFAMTLKLCAGVIRAHLNASIYCTYKNY